MTDDARLLEDVVAELRWDPRVRDAGIWTAARGGVVTLTGTVASCAQKRAAERAAERVRGVRAVANDLAVVPTGSFVRSDADLATAAAEALRWSAEVPPGSVWVTVEDARVRLTGSVDWHFQRRAAERTVAGLAGVGAVESTIAVRPHAAAYDVAQRIREALRRTGPHDVGTIGVEVAGGTVRLRGNVASWAERRAVAHAAWAALGVTHVDDAELAVRLPVADVAQPAAGAPRAGADDETSSGRPSREGRPRSRRRGARR